jgi:hypothetical protein
MRQVERIGTGTGLTPAPSRRDYRPHAPFAELVCLSDKSIARGYAMTTRGAFSGNNIRGRRRLAGSALPAGHASMPAQSKLILFGADNA